jgi:ankyrin repeat protein
MPTAGCEKSSQEAAKTGQQGNPPAASAPAAKESTQTAARTIPKEQAEAARKKLEEMGLQYSEDAFFDNVKKGNAEAVKQFVAAGIDPNKKDSYGSTPLMLAAEKGHTETALALLDGGAQVDSKDGSGNTALIWAAGEGKVDTVKALLSRGANVNATNTSGKSALLQAAWSGHTAVVDALKQAGAEDPRR